MNVEDLIQIHERRATVSSPKYEDTFAKFQSRDFEISNFHPFGSPVPTLQMSTVASEYDSPPSPTLSERAAEATEVSVELNCACLDQGADFPHITPYSSEGL